MERFIGRWEVTSVENLEDMLQALGLKEDMQEVLKTSLPQLQYSRDGDAWVMTVITPTVTREYRFLTGQTLDMVSIDGRAVKSLMTVEDNKFVECYQSEGHESKVIREIQGDELVVTMFCKGLKSVARHKKVA